MSPLTRRSRIPVALAAAFALAVLATNFPLPTLLSQHHQLSAEAAQLHQVQSSNRALSEQNQQLNSTTEIDRLARQDYQLVLPNQTLYNVLPPSGKATSATAGRSASGDPGDQPLVSPADAPDMSPDPGLPRTPSTSGSTGANGGTGATEGAPTDGASTGDAGAASSQSSFWSRVADTLEFWK
ncbi:MAG: septum formation initiator family protein [Acidimicrobiales bacterium]